MAKKKASGSSFVMAKEVMAEIQRDPSLKGREVYANLCEKFPNEDINEASCSVAFSNARKKLGMSGRKAGSKATSKPKTATKKVATPSQKTQEISSLQAAKDFVASVGDPEKAMSAIQQLKDLQLK